jgi:two-component system cell cycle response regulator DivK
MASPAVAAVVTQSLRVRHVAAHDPVMWPPVHRKDHAPQIERARDRTQDRLPLLLIARRAACEFRMGAGDFGGRDRKVVRKGHQQRLVAHNVVEYPCQKARLGRSGANLAGIQPRQGEEALKPLRFLGEVAKRLNCHGFCALTARCYRRHFVQLFAFPKGISLSLGAVKQGWCAVTMCFAQRPAQMVLPEWKPEYQGMGKTVLIVEDNELNMKLFNDLLVAHGYQTIGTRNGIEALDLARKHRPDLILMDIQLPEVSGLEVTKWLKDDPELRVIPVVAVTAFAMKGDEERIREGGCEAYLSKPISVAKFIDTVRHFLGNGEVVR